MLFADERARFNRRVTNRIVRPLSGRFAMWSLIEHRGRRSGTVYRTPVTMFRTVADSDDGDGGDGDGGGLVILLPYGQNRDWVRNLIAAGGGRAVMNGATFDVTDPRVVPTAEAATKLGRPWCTVVGRLRTPSALLLRRKAI